MRDPKLRRLRRYIKDDEHLVTFVYGTLRPGEANYWISPAVIEYWEPCYASGQLWVSTIPFADFNVTDQGDITGSVLVMDRHSSLTQEMIHMELNAGYEPRVVSVYVPGQHGANLNIRALAWHYDVSDRQQWLEHVPSGDFRHAKKRRHGLRAP